MSVTICFFTLFPLQLIPAEHVIPLEAHDYTVNNERTDRRITMEKQKPILFHIPLVMYLPEVRPD